ncbi:DMT family transporter [Patescibacteria group bacterium]
MSTKKNESTHLFKGSSFIVLSTIAYGLYGVWSRLIESNFDAFSQNWVRSLLLLAIYGSILLISRKKWKKIEKKDIKWLALWGLSGTCTTILTFIVFNNLPLGTSYFLIYSTMILSGLVVGSLFFKEKFNLAKTLSFGLVLIGLGLIYSFSIESDKVIYLIFALLSGTMTGFWNTFSKKISGEYSNPQMLFFDSSLSILFAFTGGLIIGEKLPDFTIGIGWLPMIGFVLTNFVASNSVIHGFRYLEAQIGSLILPIEVIFATLFGYLIFGEILAVETLFGGLCIVLASIIPNLHTILKAQKKSIFLT